MHIHEYCSCCNWASSAFLFTSSFRFSAACPFHILVGWYNDQFPHIPRYGPAAVNEMLSSAACLRGLSLAHESRGDLHTYREAMKMLLSSVRCFHIIVRTAPNKSFQHCLILLLLTFFIYLLSDMCLLFSQCPKLCRKGRKSSPVHHSCQTLLEHLPDSDTNSLGKMAAPETPGEDPDCSGPYKLQIYKCMNPSCLLPHLCYTFIKPGNFSCWPHVWRSRFS